MIMVFPWGNAMPTFPSLRGSAGNHKNNDSTNFKNLETTDFSLDPIQISMVCKCSLLPDKYLLICENSVTPLLNERSFAWDNLCSWLEEGWEKHLTDFDPWSRETDFNFSAISCKIWKKNSIGFTWSFII